MPTSRSADRSTPAQASAAAGLPPVLRLIHGQHGGPGEGPGEAGSASVPGVVTHRPGRTALVFDSPHSGTDYPADFGAVVPLPLLRQAEDTHVEKLYAFAPELGVHWVEAHFPRSYLDANRDVAEIDLAMIEGGTWDGPVSDDPVVLQKVRLGKGLIWKCTDDGLPIYDRLLTPAEVTARIDRCWRPYHAAVARAIDAAHAAHGHSIHIDCHSMPAVAGRFATLQPGLAHADFVVGDRDGSTASPALSRAICDFLRARGYSVDHNRPYKGVELVRRYGRPAEQRHSIQVEINRARYMDEATLAIQPEGFARLQADLRALTEWLLTVDPRAL